MTNKILNKVILLTVYLGDNEYTILRRWSVVHYFVPSEVPDTVWKLILRDRFGLEHIKILILRTAIINQSNRAQQIMEIICTKHTLKILAHSVGPKYYKVGKKYTFKKNPNKEFISCCSEV